MVSPELNDQNRATGSVRFSEAELCFRSTAARDTGGRQNLNRCEDAVPVLKDISGERVLLGVADGLGGYAQGFDNRSGGQIASATAMKIAVDYFSRSPPGEKADAESLTNSIFKRLRHLAENRLAPSRVRGALGRHKLATTLAVVVLDAKSAFPKIKFQCYWIGDSRIYFFDREGLHQLSRDDNLTGSDAFDSILDPPPMNQFLAASMEREWRINDRELVLDCPGVVIACTDGCYSDWRNPWNFEAALQQAVEESESWADWIQRFRMRLEPLLSDDASLVAFPVNLLDFREFKKLRTKTKSVLARCLSAERDDKLAAKEIWSSIYKPMYESAPGGDECTALPDSPDSPEGVPGGVASQPLISDRIAADPAKFSAPALRQPLLIARIHSTGTMLGGVWLIGFGCGLWFGEKILAWLGFFWHWLQSLWQST